MRGENNTDHCLSSSVHQYPDYAHWCLVLKENMYVQQRMMTDVVSPNVHRCADKHVFVSNIASSLQLRIFLSVC